MPKSKMRKKTPKANTEADLKAALNKIKVLEEQFKNKIEPAPAAPINPADLAPQNIDAKDRPVSSLLPPGTVIPPIPADAVRIDLGCGRRKEPGFRGLDRVQVEGVDIVHDVLTLPWPFESESVDEFRASHLLEHFWGEDQTRIMDEAFRCLKFGGLFTVVVPAWNSVRQWQDPTHKSPFPDAKAWYFNKAFRDVNLLSHYDIKSDFDVDFNYTITDPNPATGIGGYVNRTKEVQMNAMWYYNNVVSDVTMVFRKNRRT